MPKITFLSNLLGIYVFVGCPHCSCLLLHLVDIHFPGQQENSTHHTNFTLHKASLALSLSRACSSVVLARLIYKLLSYFLARKIHLFLFFSCDISWRIRCLRGAVINKVFIGKNWHPQNRGPSLARVQVSFCLSYTWAEGAFTRHLLGQ